MGRLKFAGLAFLSLAVIILPRFTFAALRASDTEAAPDTHSTTATLMNTDAAEPLPESNTDAKSVPTAQDEELAKAAEAAKAANSTAPTKARIEKRVRRAEAFIAGSEWEFDGFIAGGQDQQVKSMFATNDLVYLNIGSEQGLAAGERLGVYRRGEKIKDPQSGKALGYEVRKLGIIEVTDRLDGQTCSARVIQAYEAAEIGDLVRKE